MERIVLPTAILMIAVGCQSESERVAELASRHATQQAELSRETVELQTELVEGTQQLVKADAQARRDFLELQGNLDKQRAEIERHHDELDGERRDLAKQRHRDPIVAEALLAIGSLLACLLPLLLAGYLLRCQLGESGDHATTEILLDEVAATHSALAVSNRPALNHSSDSSEPVSEAANNNI